MQELPHQLPIITIMKSAIFVGLALTFVGVNASAQTQPLDLNLPPASASAITDALVPSASVAGNDVVDAADSVPKKDATKSGVNVSGSVGTTIGYAKGYGTGISNDATLDMSKQTDDGHYFSLHVHVEKGSPIPFRGSGYPYAW